MITTVEQIAATLEKSGYETLIEGSAVFTKIGGNSKPYTAVLEVINGHLNVSCELAKLGEFEEDKLPELFASALSANTAINPFAFAIIDESDDDSITCAEEYSLILTDKLPMTDLSEAEVEFTMNSLWIALSEGVSVIKSGFSATTLSA
jgi:hypothetical protein